MFDFERRKLFRQNIEPLRGDVHRYLLWLCYDPTLVEDVLQETMLKAWRSIASLKDIKAAKAWLLTIARRELIGEFRSRRLQTVDIDSIGELAESTETDQQELDDMRRAVRQLELNYREPLILQVWFGFSTREIAEQLQLNHQAVLTRLFRAREKLRVALNAEQTEQKDANTHSQLSSKST